MLTNLDQILKASSQDVIQKENSFFLLLFREIEDKKDKKESLIRIKNEVLKDNTESVEKNNTSSAREVLLEKKRSFSENSPVPIHISKFPVFF